MLAKLLLRPRQRARAEPLLDGLEAAMPYASPWLATRISGAINAGTGFACYGIKAVKAT